VNVSVTQNAASMMIALVASSARTILVVHMASVSIVTLRMIATACIPVTVT